MTIELSASPRGPYSLALSARLAGDATRSFRDGVFEAALEVDDAAQVVRAWQRPDGSVVLSGPTRSSLDELRRILALDDDHSEFVHRFARDPLVGHPIRRLHGLRSIRVATVAQALLRALCGQLIESRRARLMERRIVQKSTAPVAGTRYHLPPRRESLGRASAAELRALGLHARRSATLLRLCHTLDLERLNEVTTDVVAQRLGRERGLGPWSVGVVCVEGLGRREHGLVGDLGLIKLCAALRGRRADASDTEELLAPYGEWAGLASVYLLAGFKYAQISLPDGSRARRDPRMRAA